MLIALQRKVYAGKREILSGNYESIHKEYLIGGLPEIRDCKIGLLGLGAIGRIVARIAAVMGAHVSYFDVFRADSSVEKELNLTYCTYEEVLTDNEVVSLHMPLNDDTHHMISKKAFDMMQPGAILINTARGGVVDNKALADALISGHLGGAVIDHFDPDPPPPDHPLLHLPPDISDKIIVSPHIAGVTFGSFKRMLVEAVGNIQRVAAGEDPKYVVNGVAKARPKK